VLCDISLLSTLPPGVYISGCAEIIKCGIIADGDLFETLKSPIHEQLEDVITRCIKIKRDIVTEDEFEHNSRKLLNFGHTVGHAIESLSEYTIPHGQAVAAGIAVETGISYKMGLCSENCLSDVLDMLRRYDLPETTSFSADEIAQACLSDKKRDGSCLTMVLPVKTGKCVLKDIPIIELKETIRTGLETGI